ncbi:MAG: hypothetical protein RL208_470 [Pseudomonadota bacterium]|jgi:hypothetical protein
MYSLSWEVQKFFISKLQSVSLLKANAVNVYTTVPAGAKMPYFKIVNIAVEDNLSIDKEVVKFSFSLHCIFQGKSNKMLLEMLESVYKELPPLIANQSSVENVFRVSAITGCNYSISQDVSNNLWIGNVNVSFVVVR